MCDVEATLETGIQLDTKALGSAGACRLMQDRINWYRVRDRMVGY